MNREQIVPLHRYYIGNRYFLLKERVNRQLGLPIPRFLLKDE